MLYIYTLLYRYAYLSLEIFFVLANPGDFRVCVDDGRNAIVVDVWRALIVECREVHE